MILNELISKIYVNTDMVDTFIKTFLQHMLQNHIVKLVSRRVFKIIKSKLYFKICKLKDIIERKSSLP